eukprot:491464-Pyramimonas_sp.AAC.1
MDWRIAIQVASDDGVWYGSSDDGDIRMRTTYNQHDATYFVFHNPGSLFAVLACRCSGTSFTDIVEIVGGEGRATWMSLRRMHHEGPHAGKGFDMQCGVGLFSAQERAGMWKFLELCQPVVVMMSPPCQGRAGWSTFNRM